MYEFRNFRELDVNPYRYWLHGRADYFNTETYQGQISPWEMGSKFNHALFMFFPIWAFAFFGREYRKNLRLKNVKMDIVGIWSQHHA